MRRFHQFVVIAIMWIILLVNVPVVQGQSGFPGDSQPGLAEISSVYPPISTASTINGMTIGFARENGKTTIWLRVCADSPNFQLRSEAVGQWITEVFHRTAAAGGCSPSPTSWWRMVMNADPNTGEEFRIYGTANDAILSEDAFMRRAGRISCFVTGYGTGYCNSDTMRHVVPEATIDEPGIGVTLQGQVLVRGWAVDSASWNGTGVSTVHIAVNGNHIGVANYGEPRGDVAAFFGDARFTASQYSFLLDTTQIANGPATLQVGYQMAHTGQWFTVDRTVVISNTQPGNIPPNPPTLVAPADGIQVANGSVQLTVQDGGDPDNAPRTYRDYFFRVSKSDGSWSTESGWITSTTWDVALPHAGTYSWQVMAGDGAVGSVWAGPRTITYTPPSPDTILNVRYVDQVFAQRSVIQGYWIYCGPSSLAMMLHFYSKESRDVFTDRNPTLDLAREMNVGMAGTYKSAIIAALSRRGLESTSVAISADAIRSSIRAGHPVLLSTLNPNHLSLIIGERANGNFIIHDPMGGKNWAAYQWSNKGNRNDQPWASGGFFDNPRNKGERIEYTFAELQSMNINYLLRVSGTMPTLQARTSQVNLANDTFMGEGLNIQFGTAQTAVAATNIITVTHVPQRAPEHSSTEFTNSVAAFRLSAQSGSQQISRLPEQFTIKLAINPQVIAAWGERNGVSSAATPLPGVVDRTHPVTDGLVLAVWNATRNTWVALPTTFNPETNEVSTQSAQFGDYAVFMRSDPNLLFLPLLRR